MPITPQHFHTAYRSVDRVAGENGKGYLQGIGAWPVAAALIATQRSKTRLRSVADLGQPFAQPGGQIILFVIAEELHQSPVTPQKKESGSAFASASTGPFLNAMGDAGGDLIDVMAGAEKAHRARDFLLLVRVADQGFVAQGDHAIRPSAVEITRQLRHLKPFAHKTLKVRATGGVS